MKIFTVDKIRKADNYTIKHEPINSIDLMERASLSISQWILNHYSKKTHFIFVIGKGNNAGDGLAVARLLNSYGFECYYYLAIGVEGSIDFRENLSRIENNTSLIQIKKESALKELSLNLKNKVFIDALFGSGLSREIKGELADLLDWLNHQTGDKLAIDIPSGLFADKATTSPAFQADITLSLEFPKLAFMMPENHAIVGKWVILPIGLHQKFIEEEESAYQLIEPQDIRLPNVSQIAHKGMRGRCTIIAGGYGRMGAAILAASAALRSGIGLLNTQVCKHCVDIIQNTLPESLIAVDEHEYELGQYLGYEEQDVIAFGPAVGFADKTKKLLEMLLNQYKGQLVLDADAITMLANHKFLLSLLPENTVLTPHIGEFDRLVGKQDNHFLRLAQLQQFAKTYKCIVVLKGKYTAIADSKGNLYFNATGNNGLAKGGSGDVLTGMIAGLAPQYKNPLETVKAAVYLHGLSADLLAANTSKMYMNSSDLVKNLHFAQKKLSLMQ